MSPDPAWQDLTDSSGGKIMVGLHNKVKSHIVITMTVIAITI